MKRLLILSLVATTMSFNGIAQEDSLAAPSDFKPKNELGLSVRYYGVRPSLELDYVRRFRKGAQLNLSGFGGFGSFSTLPFYSWGVSAYYRHNWNIKNGLNWYLGGGVIGRFYRNVADQPDYSLGLGAKLGMEYDFNVHKVPLILGMDINPTYRFIGGNNFFSVDPKLSLRFTF